MNCTLSRCHPRYALVDGPLWNTVRVYSAASGSTRTTGTMGYPRSDMRRSVRMHRPYVSIASLSRITHFSNHLNVKSDCFWTSNGRSLIGIRYQTTDSSKPGKDDATQNGTPTDDIAPLLANIEEVVDIPPEAFDGLIDRSKYTEVVPIRMPDLGLSQAPDQLSQVKEWFLSPGMVVQREAVLCDIATPDFTFGMETDDDELGIMGEIFVPAGQPVPDGTVLCHVYHEAKPGTSPAAESPRLVVEDDEDDEEEEESTEAAAKPEDDDEGDDDDDKDRGKPIDPTTTQKS